MHCFWLWPPKTSFAREGVATVATIGVTPLADEMMRPGWIPATAQAKNRKRRKYRKNNA